LINLIELPREYCQDFTLCEIASVLGTPLIIDNVTHNRLFGHYAHTCRYESPSSLISWNTCGKGGFCS